MSSFMDLVANRRSIRRYKAKNVESWMVESCVEAARLAPSACNGQPWKFIVVSSRKAKDTFSKKCFTGPYAAMKPIIESAPVLIVMLRERPKIHVGIAGLFSGIDYTQCDVGIAGEHLVLRAAELGLGTCWIGWFNSKAATKLLRLNRYIPTAVFTLGWSAENPEARPRKPLKSIMKTL